MRFKVGDRVKITGFSISYSPMFRGLIGEVIRVSAFGYLVSLKEYEYPQWFYENQLEKVE